MRSQAKIIQTTNLPILAECLVKALTGEHPLPVHLAVSGLSDTVYNVHAAREQIYTHTYIYILTAAFCTDMMKHPPRSSDFACTSTFSTDEGNSKNLT